jgi:hypothetical protein
LQPEFAKIDLRLREAVPLRLPRWDFRYFTRFGINGIKFLLRLQPALVPELAAVAVAKQG